MGSDQELERLRQQALAQADASRERERAVREKTKQVARSDLSAWKHVISRSVNGRGRRPITFFANASRWKWFYSGPPGLRRDDVWDQIYTYADELQDLLGSPFRVHVGYAESGENYEYENTNYLGQYIEVNW